MDAHTRRDEILVQAAVLTILQGDTLELIDALAEEMRDIINQFEYTHEGNVPSKDEIIYILGVHHHKNPRTESLIK